MSIIDYEIDEIRKVCENVVPNSKIVACITKPSPLVRVDIQIKSTYRQLTVCLRFSADYPADTLLIELKSKYLSAKFLDGLTVLCEAEVRTKLGQRQCLHVLSFIQQYINQNRLCVCFDEIQRLRADLGSTSNLKLKQGASTLILTARGDAYFYRIRAVVAVDYPLSSVELRDPETNLPPVLLRYLNGQSQEIARQCVEPPLFKGKEKKQPAEFQPKPSVHLALKFCFEALQDFPDELCPICEKHVLPTNPSDLVLDDSNDKFVERAYCGHLYHQGCLKLYLQQPPFPKSGKICPAVRRHPRSDARYYLSRTCVAETISAGDTCGLRLSYDRWVVNAQVAEARWAQKQARARELQEVMEFLQH